MRNVLTLIPLLCTSVLAGPGTVAADVLGSPACGVLNVTPNGRNEHIELLGVRPLEDAASHERCRTLGAKLAGKKVLLIFPEGLRQFPNRKRANVFNKDNHLIAADLLRSGYAQAVTVTGNPYNSALAILSQVAHTRKTGAWR